MFNIAGWKDRQNIHLWQFDSNRNRTAKGFEQHVQHVYLYFEVFWAVKNGPVSDVVDAAYKDIDL